MTSFKKFALFLVTAVSVLSVQAQTGSHDADRRMRNREEIVARHQQMDRAGKTPVLTSARWHRHHSHVHHRHVRMDHHHVG